MGVGHPGVSPTLTRHRLSPQGSSSSDSLEGQSCDYASKSYDAVVFDVLKVTPEEFAVSNRTDVCAGGGQGWGSVLRSEITHIPNDRGLLSKVFFTKYHAALNGMLSI